MPSYTTSLRLVQPATGEYSGTWGTEVNNGLTALVDASIAGTSSITMTAANFTLTTANGASDQSRAMFLVLGGTPGASYAVIVPSVSKLYFVTNNTGFAQTVRTSGTGISVPNGASMTLRCDGTNVVVAQNYFASMTLGSALPAASGGTGSSSAFTANGIVYASSTSVLATGSALTFDGTNFATTGTSSATKLIPTGGSATGNGMYLPAANTLAWSNNGAETMRLDSSGNLGVGTNSPGARLDVQSGQAEIRTLSTTGTNTVRNFQSNTGGQFYQGIDSSTGGNFGIAYAAVLWHSGNYPMVFATNNTERARITSGGDLLVGTTTGAGLGVTVQPSSTTIQNNNAQATGFVFTSYRRSSVEIGSITQNGTTAVLYNTTSDRRLKDNIVPAPSASDVIDAIEIVSHDWKSAPDEHVTYGVIAQDLALVAPQAVLEGDDGEEVEKTWGVDYSKLVPMLIKEIQSLRARVAALEKT